MKMIAACKKLHRSSRLLKQSSEHLKSQEIRELQDSSVEMLKEDLQISSSFRMSFQSNF